MEIRTNGKRNINLPDVLEKQRVILKDLNGEEVSFIKTGKNRARITGVIPDIVFVEIKEKSLRPVDTRALNIAKTIDLTDEINLVLEKQNIIRQASQAVLDFKAEIENKFIKNKEETDVALSELAEVARNTGIINDERYEEIKAIDLSQSIDIEKIYSICRDLSEKSISVENDILNITNVLASHKHEKQTKDSLGLGRVDNTSDIEKPVSNAVQQALDDKVSKEEFSEFAEYITKIQKRQKEIENGIQSLGGICANPLPNGGFTGQVLTKKSDLDGDVFWADGGSGGGTSYHNQLRNRDMADQHPISAITGLQTSLTSLANEDISLKAQIDANADAILKTRNDLQGEIDDNAGYIAELQADTSTIKNDLNGLGDQVSGIEERIPDTASATNQLADKAFVDEKAKEIKESISNVYKFKGSVNTFNDLPVEGLEIGDVYNIIDTDKNYAWDGEKWDDIGGTVDSSLYALKTELPINSKTNTPLQSITADTTKVVIDGVNYTTYSVYQRMVSDDKEYPIGIKGVANTAASSSTMNFCADVTLNPSKGSIKCKELLVNGESVATKDEVPTKTSELTNDSGFITTAYVKDEINEVRTNCITEIPQDIKLELNSGTLTLKAGSKLYVPNGKNSDGSNKFDVVTVTSDASWDKSTTAGTRIAFYSVAGGLPGVVSTYGYSGDTAKMNSTSAVTYGRFYNTETNKIYVGNSNGGSWVEVTNSLPICIFKNDASGNVTSIDQVFNGFGYIGSTVFALPGVKGLIPNGRNEDGMLKNIEVVTTSVKIVTVSQYTYNIAMYQNGGLGSQTQNFRLNEVGNYNYDNTVKTEALLVGGVNQINGVITSFQPKTTFHAVDYNDFKQLDDEAVKTSGDQSISGAKMFTSVNGLKAVTSGSNNIVMKNTAVDVSESSRTTAHANTFTIYDKNDKVGGMFGTRFNTSGTNQSFLQARNLSTGSQVSGEINVSVDKNGSVITYAPTPTSAADNTTQIATTAWCTNASKNGNLFGAPNYAGVITAGNEYVAPTNGYYSFCVPNGNVNNFWYYIYVNNALVGACNGYGTTGGHMVALKKGDRVSIRRNDETTLVTVNWALFFPCA